MLGIIIDFKTSTPVPTILLRQLSERRRGWARLTKLPLTSGARESVHQERGLCESWRRVEATREVLSKGVEDNEEMNAT